MLLNEERVAALVKVDELPPGSRKTIELSSGVFGIGPSFQKDQGYGFWPPVPKEVETKWEWESGIDPSVFIG